VTSKRQPEGTTGSGIGACASLFVGKSAATADAQESMPTAARIALTKPLIFAPETNTLDCGSRKHIEP
jgi:hypothetical protein